MKTKKQPLVSPVDIAYRLIFKLINSKANAYYSSVYPGQQGYNAQFLLEDLIGLLKEFRDSDGLVDLPEAVDNYTTKMQTFNDNLYDRPCHYESPVVRQHLLDLGLIASEYCRWHYSDPPMIQIEDMIKRLEEAV